MVFWGEDKVKRRLSHREVYDLVSRTAQALAAEGVGPGDRVAGFLPNMPETVIAMLATASLGAVWSSCSPDFGVQGVLDRFGQIEPKVLFCADGYHYNGKTLDSRPRVAEFTAAAALASKKIVVASYIEETPDVSGIAKAERLRPTSSAPFEAGEIAFASPAVQRAALHHVLQRHDGEAEVHRPRHPAAPCCSISKEHQLHTT